MMGKKKIRRKLVIVGDQGCGKTFLLFRYVDNVYPEKDKPSTFGERIVGTRVGKQTVLLHIFDTDGHRYYRPHRKLICSKAHLILMCLPIDDPESIDNIIKRWTPEVERHCPAATIVLVGTKKDVRTSVSLRRLPDTDIPVPIRYEHGESLARRIGAFGYWECSAKTGEGVREVFQTAARVSMRHRSTCIIF